MAQRTLQQLFGEYIDECQYSKGLRPETIKGYAAVFGHFSTMMPEVTSTQLLTTEMVNEFFKRIRLRRRIIGRDTPKVGLENSTIYTYSSKLNAFFEWLVKRNFAKENPLKNIKVLYPKYTDQRALKNEEVCKIYSAITLHSNSSLILKRDTVMISILYFCGLRTGEFISLRVTDIDIENSLLTVRAETSKSKATRGVPIHPTLSFHLKEYIKERNKQHYKTECLIVSSSKDKGLSRDGLKHFVKKLNKSSGVKFHLHRFRHTFACNLAEKDVSVIKIQRLMGHTNLKMTVSYLRSIKTEGLQEDINKLSI